METRYVSESKEAYIEAGEVLKKGGIVAFPTDTVYGLGCIYTDSDAVRKIFEAKGRDEGKPLSVLVCDIMQVGRVADDITNDALKLMTAFWPGALTLILKKNDTVPEEVAAGGDTIGVRMPESVCARELIARSGVPLAAPSANLSGKRSSVTADDVREDLDGRIDLVIDGGECSIGVSSTVLDISDGDLKILREGVITADMIREVLGIW